MNVLSHINRKSVCVSAVRFTVRRLVVWPEFYTKVADVKNGFYSIHSKLPSKLMERNNDKRVTSNCENKIAFTNLFLTPVCLLTFQ